MWREQLSPLMGQEEVDRLDGKLKGLNISGTERGHAQNDILLSGLDSMQVHFTSMFPEPDMMVEQQFWRLLTSIGSWPQVGWA